jgi:hypothetical protein
MKVPFFNMTAGDQVKSKGMWAGWGCVGFGVYLMLNGSQEFGWGIALYGFSVLGLRDAK